MAHVSAQYWSIGHGLFTSAGPAGARVSVDGHAIATWPDFSLARAEREAAVKAGVLHLDEATAPGLMRRR